MRFEFATAQQIVFGAGVADQLPALARALGRRPLVLTGSRPERHAQLLDAVSESRCAIAVPGEPDFALVRAATDAARRTGADSVVAIGGGSVVDTGKAVAMLLANGGDPLDYAEVIGAGRAITQPSAPLVAVPTTAGAGSEVTRNAVLRDAGRGVKVSLRSPHMLPRCALVDPVLARHLPPALTAATGLDALTQLIEPFLSRRASPMTDALCREGLPRAVRALPRACRDGADLEARMDLALAALLGGMALANAGLGAVHGFAAAIGGAFDAPHGAICAILLAPVLEANARRMTDGEGRGRLAALAALVTGREGASVGELLQQIRSLVAELGIPRLQAYGIGEAHVAELCRHAAASSSMRGNPVELGPDVLAAVLRQAL